jgi:pimeloyl-ACP methyl ester carboxylesterase
LNNKAQVRYGFFGLSGALFLAVAAIAAPASVERASGQLLPPRQTAYEMRKPANWNGVLVTDLDYVTRADEPLQSWLEEHGYALAGIAREKVADGVSYDVGGEVTDLINVVDLFTARFGKPKFVIQYGLSGGGFVGLALSQTRPDRIDGVVAACAPIPVWLMNAGLDNWYTLRTLIAPNLAVTGLPKPGSPEALKLVSAWRTALSDAQKSPLGRARIALAVTIGEFPAWGTVSPTQTLPPEPDPLDFAALETAMFETLMRGAENPGGQARWMFETGSGAQPSWNTGVDYADLFANSDPTYQTATRLLYRQAGADLEADLGTINAGPRLMPDSKALKWYSSPTRTFTGDIKTPVLFMNDSGDLAVPIAGLAGSLEVIRRRGRETLARQTVVHASGHCNFEVSEVAAAIETVAHRLESGSWPEVSAAAMNQRAASLDRAAPPRFMDYNVSQHFRYSRVWLPEAAEYSGGSNVARNCVSSKSVLANSKAISSQEQDEASRRGCAE